MLGLHDIVLQPECPLQAASWHDQPRQEQLTAVIHSLLRMDSTHCRQLSVFRERTVQVFVLPASLLVDLALSTGQSLHQTLAPSSLLQSPRCCTPPAPGRLPDSCAR